ncbi:pyridoxamine 5'-phosphate oxidase family protein [Streptomyces sp. MMS24-I2-30]|uniref:pyridoxamine 5'-phosphate oxidase family protein n=1 Tax=Streptomyces sp. MMS24-I2-30 TaxID=3351564 RepID=UPI003896D3AA
MTDPARTTPAGFHGGELTVQRRAGVAREAARLSGMLAPAQLRGGVARFLAEQTFASLAARDLHGTLWVSPLTGPPGFLQVTSPAGLDMRAVPVENDPLHHLSASQQVGLIVIDFAIRRRLRISGTLSATGSDGLDVDVKQAYGNCPNTSEAGICAPRPRPPPARGRSGSATPSTRATSA